MDSVKKKKDQWIQWEMLPNMDSVKKSKDQWIPWEMLPKKDSVGPGCSRPVFFSALFSPRLRPLSTYPNRRRIAVTFLEILPVKKKQMRRLLRMHARYSCLVQVLRRMPCAGLTQLLTEELAKCLLPLSEKFPWEKLLSLQNHQRKLRCENRPWRSPFPSKVALFCKVSIRSPKKNILWKNSLKYRVSSQKKFLSLEEEEVPFPGRSS